LEERDERSTRGVIDLGGKHRGRGSLGEEFGDALALVEGWGGSGGRSVKGSGGMFTGKNPRGRDGFLTRERGCDSCRRRKAVSWGRLGNTPSFV